MAERGKRTRLEFGGVAAEVSLLKMSGKARDSRHDVRRGDAPGPLARKLEAATMAGADDEHGSLEAMLKDSPLGGLTASAPKADAGHAMGSAIADAEGRQAERAGHAGPAAAAPEPLTEPEPEVRHGIWVGDDAESEEFIDLTDQLAAIDKNTKLDGMTVLHTIGSSSVPRERVRDSHWIAAVGGARDAKVMALLWRGLRNTSLVAVVVWTVRTNQAVGIVVPRTMSDGSKALVLLELEWAQNMRKPSPMVTAPIEAEVSDREVAAATDLVNAFKSTPACLAVLADQREAKRAEILNAAREGRLKDYTPPAPRPEVEEVEDLAAAWTALAAGR